ncbi:Agglutinin [Gossypium australe]|uniref:Agglutinin n=1 Tax=Gossypium australe TaxID=47621 RepID=A0A5B6WXR6_9ROSI|nr:Agglutinin [Gossypium australe]
MQSDTLYDGTIATTEVQGATYTESSIQMALTLPKFIVLKPSDNNGYLSYIREGENNLGFLKFFETQAVSPYVKFEMEISGTNGLYCQLTKIVSIARVLLEQYWIVAIAQTNEEDQSKETCTLFKFVTVNLAIGMLLVLLKYVSFKGHNNKYLCVRENYLAFSANDIGDSTVACEAFVIDDRKVHIKSICAEKFWWAEPK